MDNKDNLYWIDYLRSTITILVIGHHAALAYTTFSFFDKEIYIRSTHPIVDNNRNVALDIFVNFNDLFFMQLMFLIGGLFLTKSILKKGNQLFLKDRIHRLAIPFLLLGTITNLIAYYPAFLISNSKGNFFSYIVDFFTTQQWPVGPPWFIWVLFLFNGIFIMILPLYQKKHQFLNKALSTFQQKPLTGVVTLIIICNVVYIPLLYIFGPYHWTGFGPFDFQSSRLLLYFTYFIFGTILGYLNFNETIFNTNSWIVNSWKYSISIAVIVFFIITIDNQTSFISRQSSFPFLKYQLEIVFSIFICIASLSFFKKSFNNSNEIWNSLSQNAYLIYLIHYPIIIWLQYYFLSVEINGLIKFSLTFIIGCFLSWLFSYMLRKINLINKFL